MSFPARRSGGPRGSNVGQKSLSSHLWPSEPCAPQREAQRGCHRWFYTCSCLAFSTLVVSVFVTQHDTVTSTFGSQTARPRFQLTAANTSELLAFLKESVLFPSFVTNIHHRFFFLRPSVLSGGGEPLVAFCSGNIVLIVSMDKTVNRCCDRSWSRTYHSPFIPCAAFRF